MVSRVVPGDVGDDAAVIACQGIEQAGFAYIGLAHNGSGNAGAQNAALIVGLQHIVQSLAVGAEIAVIILQAEILNIFVRIIQHRMEMAAQVGQVIIDGSQFFLQHTAHLAGGIGGGFGGIGLDEINDGFGLGQIQLAIQKSPLGEFTPLGGTGTGDVQRFQTGSQHGRGAVAVKFHGILAGVGMGAPGNNGHTLVDDTALPVMELTQHQLAVGGGGQGLFAV